MANPAVGYEIRQASAPDGGVTLELFVEGEPVARAAASASVLDDMRTVLGHQRDAVVADLRKALLDVLKTQGQFVEILEPAEDPKKKLRFVSRYVYRLLDDVSTGVVWYDVTESATGPESVPAVVRNRMRQDVHRKLTDPGSAARALVDLHK